MEGDARIPVLADPCGSGVVADGDYCLASPVAQAPHPPVFGCSCCRRAGPVSRALKALFLARMRGEVAPFRRVVLRGPGAGAAAGAIADDALLRARYRFAGQLPSRLAEHPVPCSGGMC